MLKAVRTVAPPQSRTQSQRIFPFFYSLGQVQDFGEMSFNVIINPFKPHGNSHSYQLDLSISILRVVVFFIFIQISIEYSVRKQWRP